jgi:hypothetical protein
MLSAGLAIAALAPASAQMPGQPTKNLRSNAFTFDYIEPRSAVWLPTFQRLKSKHVLERFVEFLSPLRLPVRFRMTTKQCNAVNAFYDPDNTWSFQMCYEFVADTDKSAPRKTTEFGLTRGEYIVGTFVGVVLHETGHGLRDILRIPVFGREEDTADQISGYLMLQFGPELARPTIKGYYYQWMKETRLDASLQWDVHSGNRQRALNYLCLAYGRYPDTFKDFLDNKLLPPDRAKNCKHEYQQIEAAFNLTIKPYIDETIMAQNRGKTWLKPEEFE